MDNRGNAHRTGGRNRLYYLFEMPDKVANLTSLAMETCCREADRIDGTPFLMLPEALLHCMEVLPLATMRRSNAPSGQHRGPAT